MLGASLMQSLQSRLTIDSYRRVLAAYEAALGAFDPQEQPQSWLETIANIGATHLDAIQSEVGDPQWHIQAAIEVFERGLALPLQEDAPQPWLKVALRLAECCEIAAEWMGPSMLVRGAAACAAALQVVTRERAPRDWAALQLRRAEALVRSGADSGLEDAIAACQAALGEMSETAEPDEWANAQILLGGCYRVRKAGDRQANIECAIDGLEQAISLIDAERHPASWYAAHYHRGALYMRRRGGDPGDNIERALLSLRIALAATLRASRPLEWAGLQATYGEACLNRTVGNRSDNIEHAIGALEEVLEVSTGEASVMPRRLLGQAYITRERGDRAENLEQAIAHLEAVSASREDLPAWCVSRAMLARAYGLRTVGDRQSNRLRAIECLEPALAFGPDSWLGVPTWFDAAAHLAHLHLDNGAATGHDTNPQSAAPPLDLSGADPFNMAGQAWQANQSLQRSVEAGEAERETDTGWHVPMLLNDEATQLRLHLETFLSSGTPPDRSPSQRTTLEAQRWHYFRLVFEHLTDKYAAAWRTRELFAEVAAGRRGYVLLLRGFAFRSHVFSGVTIGHAGGESLGEMQARLRLVEELAPVPVVFISNPVESVSLELVMAKAGADSIGFRVEAGADWETVVAQLITAAAAIVVHNPTITAGVAYEIGLLRSMGRIDDTCFADIENAKAAFDDAPQRLNPLDEAAITRLRSAGSVGPRPGSELPPPICRWIEGPRRDRVVFQAAAVQRWLDHLPAEGPSALMDLRLDALWFLVASHVLHEDIEALARDLRGLADAYAAIAPAQCEVAASLAGACERSADAIHAAWSRASAAGPSDLDRTIEALSLLAKDVEQAGT